MDIIKVRKQDMTKIIEDLEKKQAKLAEKKLMIKIGQEKNTSSIRVLQKDIAQMKTVVREKEVLNER